MRRIYYDAAMYDDPVEDQLITARNLVMFSEEVVRKLTIQLLEGDVHAPKRLQRWADTLVQDRAHLAKLEVGINGRKLFQLQDTQASDEDPLAGRNPSQRSKANA